VAFSGWQTRLDSLLVAGRPRETVSKTPELKQANEKAGGQPVRVEHPEIHPAYALIDEDHYQLLRDAVPESDLTLQTRQAKLVTVYLVE
jgi:hypothetical protein